jgi:hypothetical protein
MANQTGARQSFAPGLSVGNAALLIFLIHTVVLVGASAGGRSLTATGLTVVLHVNKQAVPDVAPPLKNYRITCTAALGREGLRQPPPKDL